MTATTTRQPRQSRASRGAAAAAADQQTPQLAAVPNPSETPKATPKPQPEPKPTAQVDLGAKPVTYWFPVATLADGTKVSCPHARYGHETEKSATSCIRALVASKGHKAA